MLVPGSLHWHFGTQADSESHILRGARIQNDQFQFGQTKPKKQSHCERDPFVRVFVVKREISSDTRLQWLQCFQRWAARLIEPRGGDRP